MIKLLRPHATSALGIIKGVVLRLVTVVIGSERPLLAGKFDAQPFTVAGTVATDSGEASAGLVETKVGSRNNMCLGWIWQVGSGPAKRKAA